MANEGDSTGNITLHIGGDATGQVAAGSHITQTHVPAPAEPPTEAELDEVRRLLAEVKARVAAETPDEAKQAALGRVDELEQAILADEPDVSTMEYVKGWFGRNLPKLAGTVTGLIVHPLVGKVVAAAGDAAVAEFRRRFGAGGR